MSANKPDIQQIRKYLNRELDARAMFEVERQAQTDPFWMDVLQGMESGGENHQPNLNAIDEFLKKRVQQDRKKVVPMWRTLSVAASILIALSIGGWWLLRNPAKPVRSDKQIAAAIRLQSGKFKTGQPPLNIKPGDLPAARPLNLTEIKTGKLAPPVTMASAQQSAIITAPVIGIVKTDTGKAELAEEKSKISQYGYINGRAANSAGKLQKSDTTVIIKNPAKYTLNEVALSPRPDTAPRQVLMSKVKGVDVVRPDNGASQNISGKIVELGTGNPIADAAIRIAGEQMAARTAADGTFKISAPASGQTLEVNSIGYQSKHVNVSGRDSLKIALAPDNNSLNEVVVARGNSPTHTVAVDKIAHPAMGWTDYKKYLEKNTAVNDDKKGNVKLSFDVDANGLISNLQIINKSAAELSQKATGLILNGPRWMGAANGKTERVKLTVKFHK